MAAERQGWTGELTLDLLNNRGWSVGAAELTVQESTVIVRYDGRSLATMDRDWFRRWLTQPHPEPCIADDLIWTVQLGITFLMTGTAVYRLTPESLRTLVAVI